jgi:hypothetical protein
MRRVEKMRNNKKKTKKTRKQKKFPEFAKTFTVKFATTISTHKKLRK